MSREDCDKPSCQILKPHQHVAGGVYFDWAKEKRKLEAEVAGYRRTLEWYADGANYSYTSKAASCGCCSVETDPSIGLDVGTRAREALASSPAMLIEAQLRAAEELAKEYEDMLSDGHVNDGCDCYQHQALAKFRAAQEGK